jgi:subfamily B ATP-binding cassette protein MsbA
MEKSNESKFKFKSFIGQVIGFVKPFGFLFVFAMILNAIFSIFNTIAVGLIKPIFSLIFSPGPKTESVPSNALERISAEYYNFLEGLIQSDTGLEHTLFNLGLLIIGVFVLKNIFKYWSSVVTVRLEEGVSKSIRDKIFSHLTSLSVDFFSRSKSGDLMSIISNDAQALNSTTVASFSVLLRELIQVVLFMVLLLGISTKLTLIAFSTSILSFIVIRVAMKYLRRYASRMQSAMANYTSTLQEAISGIRVVKAYNAEASVNEKFVKDTWNYVKSAVKHQKIITLIPAFSEVFAVVALCVVLYIGGLEIINQRMQSDNLAAFLFFLFAIMNPLITVVNSFAQFQRGSVALDRVNSILKKESSISSGYKVINGFNKSLELKNVSFSYEDSPTLKDVSVSIEKGRKIALVGPSGSGKSTFLDLVIRFYDPGAGQIMIDGDDIKEFEVESYRSMFGIVSQESMLFNDTVANNIRFGNNSITEEEIIEASKLANAFNFITNLPDGFNTYIGDRGILLSGGEKQRLSIARALVRNPEILIFDEATSSLDAESEKVVQEAINYSLKNRTAIITAHRLSTIIDCDEILVIDHGEVIERGRHSELIAHDGIYKKLYDIQFTQRAINDNED